MSGDRQQHRGERPAGYCPGTEKLVVRRFRYGRGACSSVVLADRLLLAEWCRAGDVAALRHRPYPGLAGKPGT